MSLDKRLLNDFKKLHGPWKNDIIELKSPNLVPFQPSYKGSIFEKNPVLLDTSMKKHRNTIKKRNNSKKNVKKKSLRNKHSKHYQKMSRKTL